MQSYNAPLNDMKFILEDFLNSGASDTLFKQTDLDLDDFNFILEESPKFCEEILLNTFGKTMKPFVFLSAGMKFSNFYKSMSISMKLNINCLGFLCGRSLWQDSIDIFCNQSNTEFIKWLENQGLERVEKLKSTLDL